MKLFKKLAAAVLAAALALTMAGCGGGNSYTMQNELLKVTIDKLTDIGKTVTQSKKADEMAAALLAAADTAAAQEANNGKDAEDLLLDPAVIKQPVLTPKKRLRGQPDRRRSVKSSGMMGEFLKIEWMGRSRASKTLIAMASARSTPVMMIRSRSVQLRTRSAMRAIS